MARDPSRPVVPFPSASLALPLAALVVGLLLAHGVPQAAGAPAARLGLALAALGIAAATLPGRRANGLRSRGGLALLLAGLVLVSSHHAQRSLPTTEAPLFRTAALEIPILGIEGRVVEAPLDPAPRDPGNRLGPALPPVATFVVEVEYLLVGGAAMRDDARRMRGRVQVRLPCPGQAPDLRLGDRVRAFGKLRPLRERRNEGELDRRRAGFRSGVVATLAAPHRAAVLLLARPAGIRASLRRLPAEIRAHAWRGLCRALPPREAGITGALLLGIRSALPSNDRERFRRTGTAHFFAVSGLHVALAAGMLFAGLRRAGVRRSAVAWTTAGFLGIYCGVTGGAPSVVRASVMMLAALTANALGRRIRLLDALSLAAVLLLAARPGAIFDPGFLLSFSAVGTIALLAPAPRPRRRSTGPAGRAWRHLLRSIRITGAACAGTIPIALCLHQPVAPAVFAGNLVVLPAVTALLGYGLPATALLALVPGSAPIVAPVLGALARGVPATASMVDLAPLRPLLLPVPPAGAIVLHYAAILLLAGRRPRLAAVAAAAALALFAAAARPGSPPPFPRIVVLDVGQGASALVRLPNGSTALVDAGSSSLGGIASRLVVPALRSQDLIRIDVLVLTHADSDHVNAAAELALLFPITRAVHPPGFAASREGRRILAALRRAGTPALPVAKGAVLLEDPASGSRLRVLHPPPFADPSLRSDNDTSIVLALEFAGSRFLLPGDIEEAGIDRVLRLPPGPAATGILLPHHGAQAANLEDLLDALRPSFVVVSARAGFTPASVLELVAARGIARWATWEVGQVRILLDPKGASVAGFLPRASR